MKYIEFILVFLFYSVCKLKCNLIKEGMLLQLTLFLYILYVSIKPESHQKLHDVKYHYDTI